MSEGTPSSGQYPGQQSPPQKKPDPCDEPKAPEEPKKPPTDQQTPCPPDKSEQPPPKDCPPEWDPRCPELPPDPCKGERPGGEKPPEQEPPDQKPPDQKQPDQKPPEQTPPEQKPPEQKPPEQKPPEDKDPCAKPGQTGPSTPADQLDALRKQLETEQGKIEDLEKSKASIADLTERIQSLQKVVDARKADDKTYREFYQKVYDDVHDAKCFTQRLREQLGAPGDWGAAVDDAVKNADAQLTATRTAYDTQRSKVAQLESEYAKAEWKLKDTKILYDFIKTDLLSLVKKRQDDLKQLKSATDPKKSKCDAYFYVLEIERIVASNRKPSESLPCFPPKSDPFWSGISLGTYIDCWRPDWYTRVYDQAVVRLNQAEHDEKLAKAALEAGKKRLTDLEKATKDAFDKRRETILKVLKDSPKCPTPSAP
jgi:hypothetical protein